MTAAFLFLLCLAQGIEPVGRVPTASSDDLETLGCRIYFSDSAQGWYLCGSGAIHLTRDGGKSWRRLQLPCEAKREDLPLRGRLVGDGHGWILCQRSLFVTRNAGESWQLQTRIPGSLTSQVLAIDVSPTRHQIVALAEAPLPQGSSETVVMCSADSGKSWRQRSVKPGQFRMVAIDLRTSWAYAAGRQDVLYTSDFGGRWAVARLDFRANGLEAFRADLGSPSTLSFGQRFGWLVYDNGYVLRTEDKGRSWQELARPTQVWVGNSRLVQPTLHFLTSEHGYLIGGDGVLRESYDGGLTWLPIRMGRAAEDISCFNIRSCLVRTDDGIVFRVSSISATQPRE
jgi:photosystem II stability/assembly factor-like uncharacterized protein